jgi:hypothetical protein
MRAFKFLLPGQIAPFSGFHWPLAGWVTADAESPCQAGIHACALDDLPFWLLDELWEVELGEPVGRGRHKLVGRSGRLVGRVEAWDRATGEEFAAACLDHVRRLAARRPEADGHFSDLAAWSPQLRPAAAASLAARAAEAVDGRAGYDRERAAQADWLADRLGLAPAR